MPTRAVTADEIDAARERLRGHLRPTPTIEVDGLVDVPLLLKLEVLQPTGSFKVRGATSLLRGAEVPAGGVVAASGGNFGLAVAWAARRLGHVAHVFVPDTSPAAKIDRLRALDATVHVEQGVYADALLAADEHVAATGALSAHAYDQREVVAGQGTCAMELEEQLPGVDTVIVACGGGGLLAGVAGWLGDRVRVVAVETTGTPTLHAALEAGRPLDVEVAGPAASALGARRIGALGWAARSRVAEALLVTDNEVGRQEPGGRGPAGDRQRGRRRAAAALGRVQARRRAGWRHGPGRADLGRLPAGRGRAGRGGGLRRQRRPRGSAPVTAHRLRGRRHPPGPPALAAIPRPGRGWRRGGDRAVLRVVDAGAGGGRHA